MAAELRIRGKGGRPRKYLWAEWFELGSFHLRRGVHYECSQSTMANNIRQNASSRGLHVMVIDLDDGFNVRVVESDARTHPNKTPVPR